MLEEKILPKKKAHFVWGTPKSVLLYFRYNIKFLNQNDYKFNFIK